MMTIPTRLLSSAFLLLAVSAAGFAGGCASDTQGLASAQSDYIAGRYTQAYNTSAMIVANPAQPKHTRESAAYLAGLSAYRAKSIDKAQEYLQYAAATDDPKLRANAKAQLGAVYSDKGQFRIAAENLLSSAETFTGEDKAHAYYYAGIAQQKDGLWASARTTLSLGLSASQDADLRERIKDQLRVTGYTLQTNAFSSEANARREAEGLIDKAKRNSMTPPRIVSAMDQTGKGKLYLVQLGSFSSWPTALAGRDALKPLSAIVVPIMSAGTPVAAPAASDTVAASPAPVTATRTQATSAAPGAKPAKSAPAPSGAAIAKPVAPSDKKKGK